MCPTTVLQPSEPTVEAVTGSSSGLLRLLLLLRSGGVNRYVSEKIRWWMTVLTYLATVDYSTSHPSPARGPRAGSGWRM